MKSIQLTKSQLTQLCYESGVDNDTTILEIWEEYKKQKSIPIVNHTDWFNEDCTYEIEYESYIIYYNWKLKKLFAMNKLSGAITGRNLKITFEPNGPPPLFIKE